MYQGGDRVLLCLSVFQIMHYNVQFRESRNHKSLTTHNNSCYDQPAKYEIIIGKWRERHGVSNRH